MKQFTSLVGAFFLVSTGSYAGTTLNAKTFVQSVQGAYKIKLAGGVAPHDENTLADVFADKEEGAFTLPYCDPAGAFCDPGYLFFDYTSTAVTEETLPDGSVRDEIVLSEGGKNKTYVWTKKGSTITFRNNQYTLNGKEIVLEHVLEKTSR